MANYLEMNREELTAEKAKLNEQYKKFLAMNLTQAPMPATMVIWRACTRLASCLQMCSVSSLRKCSWAATPACS